MRNGTRLRERVRDADAVSSDAAVREHTTRPLRARIGRFLGRRGPTSKQLPVASRIVWQHGDAVMTRLIHMVLLVALITAPVALGWVALTGSQSATGSSESPAAERSVPESRDASLATAAAQRLVLTWLTASAADASALQAQVLEPLPRALELPAKRPAAPAQIWIGEVAQLAPGRFDVVVTTNGGPLGAAYFSVAVQVAGDSAAALGLPSRARPPVVPGAAAYTAPALTAVASDDPAFQTVTGYLTAYLTGSTELDRWTAPDAGLVAVTPRACSAVRVDDVQMAAPDGSAPHRPVWRSWRPGPARSRAECRRPRSTR